MWTAAIGPYLRRLAAPLTRGSLVASLVAVGAARPDASGTVLAVAALTYSARHALHICLGYRRGTPRLRGLMRADLAVAGLFDAAAVTALTLHAEPVVVGAVAVPTAIAVALVSGMTARVASAEGVPRGTDWLLATGAADWVRGSLKAYDGPGVRALRDALTIKKPKWLASSYVLALLSVLFSMAVSQAAMPTVGEQLGWPTGSAGATDPTSDDGPQEPPADEQVDEPCRVVPGTGAPEPHATRLLALWRGKHGVGDDIGGCSVPAVEAPAGSGVWIVRAYCAGHLQSVAVSSPDGRAALLLGQVAEFADAHIVLAASARISSSTGDLQVVETTEGVHVLARQESSLGPLAEGVGGAACDRTFDRDSPYTIVPPGLIGAWRVLVAGAWSWPEDAGAGEFRFRADRPSRDVIATATCSALDSCFVRIGTDELRPTVDPVVAAAALLEAAPPPLSP
ncbi:hypothetical protein OJ997_05355 [Solirubrobacter phytolaccae]|uniref:Uncharacterized protein n=1 Tax=Solirubrobacter phytolaccae TaxID=1404360 RepID=A0A9X3N8S8_9ACTN|nr:hypothetical protein [Solirubrobacter phytolaccae]MDA0179711.1 hypothetical protein [Solirubrobacter phytolaccae]